MRGHSIALLRLLVITALCLTLFPAAAWAADEAPPTLDSLVIPAGISNGPSPVTFQVTATFSDDSAIVELERDGAGEIIAEGPVIIFAAPRGTATAIGWFVKQGNGSFVADVTLPRYAAVGAWSATALYARDIFDNWLNLDSAGIADAGFANSITVTGTDDTAAPVLGAFSGLPITVDVGDCDSQLWNAQFDVSITDALSGFDPQSQFILVSSAGDQVYSNGFEPISGSVYRMTFNLYPGAEAATWVSFEADLTDIVGNSTHVSGTLPNGGVNVVANPSNQTTPGPVSNVTVAVAGGNGLVDWDAPTDTGNTPITNYVIYGSVDYSQGFGQQTGDPNVTNATFPMQPDSDYTVEVVALNRCGQGPASNPLAIVTIPATGGTLSTDPYAAVVTEVSVPGGVGGGSVTISAVEPGQSPPGWLFVGEQLVITSTAATTAAHPLQLVFRVEASLAPVSILRNGVPILSTCAGDGSATPSPCIASTVVGPDFTTITILSASASTWNVAQRTLQPYDFRGFLGGVANPPTVNKVKAGDTVAVQFSLTGDQGVAFIEPGYPSLGSHVCGSSGGTEVAATPGKKGLTYDARKDVYTFWWSTRASWKGTCGTFTLKLDDGTTHTAEFRFN